MTQDRNQCKGITTKGLQCKLITKDAYCNYHKHQRHQNQSKIVDSAVSTGRRYDSIRSTKSGFIYVYTLSRLLDQSSNESLLKVRNLPNTKTSKRDQWHSFNSRKSPFILIKVGMTTQTVARRIKQWEDKCHHSLTCLYPGNEESTAANIGSSSLSILIKKFKVLDINKSTNYKSFKIEDKGFYCKNNVKLIEHEIHNILRKKYGCGDVLCAGCVKNENTVESTVKKVFNSNTFNRHNRSKDIRSSYNVHVEWFLIPKKDLKFIFSAIDSVCLKYNQ